MHALLLLLGTWHGTSVRYTTPFTHAGTSHLTIACAQPSPSGRYVICDSRSGANETIDVYAEGRPAGEYWYAEVGNASDPYRERLYIKGNTWTYHGGYTQGRRRVLFRTVNVFTGAPAAT